VKFAILEKTFSTNDEVRKWLTNEEEGNFFAVLAYDQLAGRGQRGRSWYSTPYESLLMSVGFRDFWPLNRPLFLFQAWITYQLAFFLTGLLRNTINLKWPNDLYWNHLKLGGVLTETIVQGSKPADIIVGIGINLNQLDFPEFLPNPVSAFMVSGQFFDPENIFFELTPKLEAVAFESLSLADNYILQQYTRILDGTRQFFRYFLTDTRTWENLTIQELLPDGRVYFHDVRGQRKGPYLHSQLERSVMPSFPRNAFEANG